MFKRHNLVYGGFWSDDDNANATSGVPSIAIPIVETDWLLCEWQ